MISDQLIKEGYIFTFPTLCKALQDLLIYH
ncbi:MAG: DUF1731 domain-containing protein [Candidatus Paracaedibacteraceae bacterium]|nr:DUF1731 domain-containing protein [Candidatus Paracaedibacteraceae bacterium]